MRRITRPNRRRQRGLVAVVCAGALAFAIVAASASGASNWSTVTSVKAGGGMAALVKAAKAEGHLNLIADPFNWTNYGEIIKSFGKKYGIKVTDVNQDGTSQD